MTRLRVGVIGAGVIAQVMHLHYLRELADEYEVVALCDVSSTVDSVAARFGVPRVYADWRKLVHGEHGELDAVLVLTSGSHATIATEAARAGRHVLVEKPMCLSVPEGEQLRATAAERGVTLMVAYPKRYDPAFARFQAEVAGLAHPRLLRVTTFESPFQPYVAHYPLATPPAPPSPEVVRSWRAETDSSISTALGPSAGEFARRTYHEVLLDCMVHELNTLRALLGEPDRLDYADLRPDGVTLMLRFGELPVAVHWLDLPGMTRYQMEFAAYAPDRRVTLRFPSPYLRSAPAELSLESGQAGTTRSSRSEEITSYESGFKRELLAFHDCVVSGRAPVTDATDALHDIALCRSIMDSFNTRAPVDRPSALS
jgi:predicted dehydrogenase